MGQDFQKSPSNSNNIRQLTTSSGGSQNQILSALDTLGAKLVRSESERETMRKLLNEALDAQDRLENQLERSQLDLQQRLDRLNETSGLSDEDRAALQDQKTQLESTKNTIEETAQKQFKMEDKLRDNEALINKLQGRLEAQEQKRARLQRRIERVENIASEAQQALEAKAMVLLTDQNKFIENLPQMKADIPVESLNALHHRHALEQDNDDDRPFYQKALSTMTSGSTSWLAILVALGLGWAMASSLQPSEKAFVVMENGQMAKVDLDKGEAQPIAFNATPLSLNLTEVTAPEAQASAVSAESGSIEGEIAMLETEWITQSVIEEALNTKTAQDIDTALGTQDDNLTETAETESDAVTDTDIEADATLSVAMDRDLSLPDNLKLLEQEAFNGVPEAQHDLAALYTAGQGGVTLNYERASYWFRQAADQGIGNAAYNLGVLYQQGLGQEQDLQRALDWYRRAAQLGHPEAQYNLGIAYMEGVGTRYNPAMAAAFFQKSAFSGIVEAAYNLGLILENGLLGEVRKDDALRWYRGAAENGSLDARQAFQALAQSMGIPETIAGLLESGGSLAQFIRPINRMEPAAGGNAEKAALFKQAREDISLGTLVPTEEQILVSQIQEQLRQARLYNGPQDGIVGAGTIKAIQTYQRQNNMTVDGKATQDLLKYMLQQGTL